MFWFVFGIVLITRVSMQIGSTLAKGYGVALGGAVALVASRLGGFSAVLADRYGRCLVGDAQADLRLHAARRGSRRGRWACSRRAGWIRPDAPQRPGPDDRPADPDADGRLALAPAPWWKLWESRVGPGRRPHAPGVTLVYFTLASLPIFGLGQWFVPAVDEDRRAGLFVYFLAYIASGMGLLLATSFLNLRRYLRQRKLKMPGAMTATWLSTGAILIVGLTAAAAVLPLPSRA